MNGAELLALARHNRGAGETDAETAMHLASALALLFWSITTEQRREAVARVLGLHRRMLANGDPKQCPAVIGDQCEYDQGITPWTR